MCYNFADPRFIAPYIADRFGRRVGTAIGVVILLIGVIIQGVWYKALEQ